MGEQNSAGPWNSYLCPMPSFPRLLALATLFGAAPAVAQASPYVTLDDPRRPAFEHLVARGEVADPTPQQRPFRRRDAVAALDSAVARGTLRDTALAAALRATWQDDSAEARWELALAAGGQGFTEARRDLLHPAGPDGVRPYAELRLLAAFGPIIAVSRPTIEPRLTRDPDWAGRRDLKVTGRHPEAYISAQFKYLELFYGQVEQNWGPGSFPGIGLSDAGYPRPGVSFALGSRRLRLVAQAATLADTTDGTGETINRYFFFHRISAQVTPRLDLALWETTVLAGPGRSFSPRYRNPVTLLLLANQYGLGADGNVMIGADLTWRIGAGRILAQLGLDDFQYQPGDVPNRYAFSLMAEGPLGRRLAWRAGYTQASSLAFRSNRPFEAFLDQGVGIGRNYADNDQLSVGVSAPVLHDWIVAPELTLLRQGQGRIVAPWPAVSPAGGTPTLFIGTVERTWRAAVDVAGRRGPLALRVNAGIHHVQHAGHVADRTRTAFVGRVQATLGLDWLGRF